MTTEILQRAVEHARTHSTDDEARRTLKALRQLIREGHQAGWLVRHPEQLLARLTAPVAFRPTTQGETSLRISPTQVPTETAVAAAAWATQTVPRARWRDELMVQLAATAGPRLGELLDLDVTDVLPGRGIAIDSQVLEVGGVKTCSLPKGDKRRTTVHRAIGPGGYDVTHDANTRITMEMYIGSTGEHLERLASLG